MTSNSSTAAEPALVIGLVSVSDRASAGVYQDQGIPALRDWLVNDVLLPCYRPLVSGLNVWQWAEMRRRLSKEVSAVTGSYRVATAPFQREPQEAFTSEEVQTTVLRWGKRLGKTEMINNLHGSIIEQNPRNILVVYPTLDSAKKWSKQFFTPLIRSTPALRDKIFKNMSSRAAETLKEDLESRGPIRLSEVETQQKEILKVVRRLSDEGQIVLGGKGEDSFV